MAYRALRADSSEESTGSGNHQLERERDRNDQKLKARFEHIFRKYERDFEGVGDEIEIASGDVVVDNGHLQYMQHEVDPGKSASSRFVRTFQQKLEHEEESTSEDDEDEEEDEDEDEEMGVGETDSEQDTDYSSEPDDHVEELSRGRRRSSHHASNARASFQSLGDLARPAPRLAHLLVDSGVTEQSPNLMAREDSMYDSNDESIFEAQPTPDMSRGFPARPVPMYSQPPRDTRARTDSATASGSIEALGASIANQLAQLMAGSSKKKSKRPRKKRAQNSRESAWEYPELPRTNRRKRRRSPSIDYQRSPSPISPPGSPGTDSLWALSASGARAMKRKKLDADARSTPCNITGGSRLMQSSELGSIRSGARCWNCSVVTSSDWLKGPHGQDLCLSCGKYFERHRRMKPFDSPTPSFGDDEESSQLSELAGSRTDPIASPVLQIKPRPVSQEFQPGAEHYQEQSRTVNQHSPPERSSRSRATGEAAMAGVIDQSGLDIGQHSVFRHYTPTLAMPPDRHPSLSGYGANTSRLLAETPVSETRGQYTVEEDASIIRLKEQEKLCWSAIAHHFPTRTVFALQNHYRDRLLDKDCPGRYLLAQQERNDSPATNAAKVSSSHKVLLNALSARLPGVPAEPVEGRGALLTESKDAVFTEVKTDNTSYDEHDGALPAPTPNIKGSFTAEEDAMIVRLREVEGLAWTEVAARYPQRNLHSLQGRYSKCLAPGKRNQLRTLKSDSFQGTIEERLLAVDPELAGERKFTPDEDALIQRLKNEGRLGWRGIATHFTDRTANALKNRHAYLYLKNETKKAPRSSTPMSEGFLQPWRAKISKASSPAGVRQNLTQSSTSPRPTTARVQSVEQLRSEEASELSARLSPFTEAEHFIIVQLRDEQGCSWDQIAQQLPSRTAESISEHYTRLRPGNQSIVFDPGKAVSQKSQNRPRQTLPARLPSAQARNGTSLLRQALGNSLRRRSDGVSRPSDAEIAASHDAPVSFAPNDKTDESLFVSVDDIVHVNSHNPLAQTSETQANPEQTSPTSSESSDICMFENLMQAATKFSIQQRSPTLFVRVREIYDKDPSDPRLKRLLDATARLSVTTSGALETLDRIANGPLESTSPSTSTSTTIQAESASPKASSSTTAPTSVSSQRFLHDEAGNLTSAQRRLFGKSTRSRTRNGEENATGTELVSTKESSTRRARHTVLPHLDNEVGAGSSSTGGPQIEQPRSKKYNTLAPPEMTWTELISAAFEGQASSPLRSRDIYAWIENNFEYYHGNSSSWRARVRSELTKQPCFQRAKLSGGTNGWRLTSQPEQIHAKNGVALVSQPDEPNKTTAVRRDAEIEVVNIGPKQRRLRSSVPKKMAKQQGNAAYMHFSAGETESASCKRPNAGRDLAIPDSEDEEEITMTGDDDDELTPVSSPPKAVLSIGKMPAPEREHGDLAVQRPARSVAASSSSPAFVKPKTTPSTYGAAMTPKTKPALLSRSKRQPAGARPSTPVAHLRSSASKVTTSKGLFKRVVETPVREMEPDEDELG